MGRPRKEQHAPEARDKWDVQRLLERAVTSRLGEFAGDIVGKLRGLADEALQVLVKDMKDPDVPASVRGANARFVLEMTTNTLLNADAAKATKALGLPITITVEEVRDRIEHDPDYASALACDDADLAVGGEGAGPKN